MFRFFAMLPLVILGFTGSGSASPKVVASVPPIHSLAAGVMNGVGEPRLLLRGAASPHAYALRPSGARALAQADLIFWIAPDLESFLIKQLKALAGRARIVQLSGLADIAHRKRSGAQRHGGEDFHIWLDPDNAAVIVRKMMQSLRELDGENAAAYGANGSALLHRLKVVGRRIEDQLAPVRDRPFVVLHDGYRHFVQRFALRQAGALGLNAELSPGAKRLRAIKRLIRQNNVVCVFGEARAAPASLNIAAEGTGARTGRLDALGLGIAPGPDVYFELLMGLAGEFRRCLGRRE